MNFQDFQKQFHTMNRQDPRFKQLCTSYPHYKRAIMDRAWQQIAKIRQRKDQHTQPTSPSS